MTISTPRPIYILGALAAVLVLMLLPYCDRPGPVSRTPSVEEVARSLRPDETDKVVVAADGVVAVRRDPATGRVTGNRRYVPPEGRVDVVVKKTGEVVVRVKNKGFTLRPGVGVGAFGGRLAPVVDVKFAYWNRFGATVGAGLTRGTVGRPFGALTFQMYNNTALFLGRTIGAETVIGVRLSF